MIVSNTSKFAKYLIFLFVFLIFSLGISKADETANEDTSKKTEAEQLEGYKQITNWLINNKENFDEIIRENAVETETKWFIEEEKYKSKSQSQEESQEALKAESDAQAKANTKSTIDSANPKIQKLFHLIKKGDTLYSISKTYGIPQEDILKWNNLSGAEGIQLGKVLTLYDMEAYEKQKGNKKIEESLTVEQPPMSAKLKDTKDAEDATLETDTNDDESSIDMPEYKYYRVKKGDTFSSIAKSYHMTKEEFYVLNNFDGQTILSVDQIVKVKNNHGAYEKKETSGIVKDGFIWPIVGRLLIPFGTQEQGLVNEGINIAAKKGRDVKATQEGMVIYVGNGLKSFGNLILIQHDKNWISVYAHVDNIAVKKGQKVTKGEVIAKVSDSGNVNTPQLHFELRYNVKPMDPLNYLVSYR